MNTVTLRLRDADGEPAEGTELPRVRLTSGDLAGDVPLARTGPGTSRDVSSSPATASGRSRSRCG